MKKYNIFSVIILCLFVFIGCDNDDEHIKLGSEDSIEKPVFTQNVLQNFSIDEDTDQSEKIGEWTWTRTDYGVQAAPVYTIEVADNQSFENSKDLMASSGASTEITYKVVNDAAILFVDKTQEVTLYFRLRTSLSAVDAGPIFYSETKSITFTCYYISPLPTEMYMTGTDFGGWSWDAAGTVQLVPVNGVEGAFWCVKYLTAGNGVKWSPDKTWDNSFGKQDTSDGFTNDGDGNAVVASDGLYMVYIDVAAKKLTMEAARVYGMGDCFGGWNAGQYPFTNNGRTTSITTVATGDLRIYVESKIATTDWWTREFIVRGGKIEYRGTGGDQEPRVNVGAGKTVTLDFNAGTGTI